MDGITELALMLKGGQPSSAPSAITGTIVTRSPIQIRMNDVIVLDRDELIATASFMNRDIAIGDEVMLLPTADGQTYFVIDKVVRL